MPAPLLFTKLFIPPSRPNLVLRPHLIQRLTEGLTGKLTLISAPAGAGKTTLVSEWATRCGRPVAWLSLDEGDNDPARFLAYLNAALQTISTDTGNWVVGGMQTTPPQTAIPEFLLTTLLNDVTTIPHSFILVLDDYHLIDAYPIDRALTFLLDHLPSQMHLVIATREDPSLPLPRYRARGQLTELRATDLRFTPEEAGAFLNQVMNLNLSVEAVAALETRTEGWIAGLQMAVLSMQGRSDVDSFIHAFTGSHRFVLDYLVEEVLQRQSEQVRSFLLQTAILDRFCAPLCNAVTERDDGKEMLEVLDRSNLFIIPLDDQRQWYRYHHLFTDVLQTHLIEAQPDRVAALHLRASAWYELNGFQSDAIRHTLAAEDFERAAGLIEKAWPAAEEGSIPQAAWLGWVKTLPAERIHARPALNVWYAYALLGIGELEAAEARFTDAEWCLEPADGPLKSQLEPPSVEMVVADHDQFNYLTATIAIGRAYIAQALGRTAETVQYARQVLELVPDGGSFRHSQACMMLGMAHWASGDLEAADRVFADYTVKLRKTGNLPDAISTTVVLADIRLALGRLREAIGTIEQLLQLVMDRGEPIPPETADLHRGLSELYLEQGDLETAVRHLQHSQQMGEKAELPVWRYRQCIAQARLDQASGNLDSALALLDEAERRYIRTPLPEFHSIASMRARIWVVQGRLDQALGWVREQGLSPDDDLSYLHEFEHVTLARTLIAQYRSDRVDGSLHAAVRLLDRLLQAADQGFRMGSVIEILLLQALAYQAQDDLRLARASLERALALAEPQGYVHLFVDEGKPMAELLAKVEEKKINTARKRIYHPVAFRYRRAHCS
jgi:LuxR family transcriptional regulator, maltose regulon positive regulatory protein